MPAPPRILPSVLVSPLSTKSPVAAATLAADDAGVVRLTGGNIRNSHIYLRTVQRLLPPDVIGGANASAAARRQFTVTFDPGPTIETDVAEDKMILRARGPVRAFFAASGALEGDKVVIKRTAPYALHISLQPRRAE